MAEHRAAVPEALRGSVKEVVLIHGAHDRRGALRTERKLVAVHRIGEGIHFLLDDIGHFAHAAREDAGIFKNRRTDFLIAVLFEDAHAGLLHKLPDGGVLREHVVHALDAGEFFLSHFA